MDKIKMNHKMDKTFEEGFEEYVLDMKARNLRQGTISHYQESIKQIYKRIPPTTMISTLSKRTMKEFYVALREKVKEKHLRLYIVGSINVDCSNGELDPMTNAFIQMSGVFAELELRIIRSRVKSGTANAKAKGVQIGRPHLAKDQIPNIFSNIIPQTKTSNSTSANWQEFVEWAGQRFTNILNFWKK